MMPVTECPSNGSMTPSHMPWNPFRTPTTSSPRCHATRTDERIAAFMPGASPPLVTIAMRFIVCPHSQVRLNDATGDSHLLYAQQEARVNARTPNSTPEDN